MEVNTKRRKFIGDIEEEDMQIIEAACNIEKRSRISLIRKASIEYAKKVISEVKPVPNVETI